MSGGHARKIKTAAILGGGPAASMLATRLCRAGITVAIFYKKRNAALLVGESLVPAIIPMLRELGVEDEVRGFGMLKPGATFNISDTVNLSFDFGRLAGCKPGYAYNVPRDRFDETVLGAAKKAGARIFEIAAGLERVEGTDKVRLDAETMQALGNFFPGQPDLIVDATGRVRLLPNLMGIEARAGGRKDTALFAHVDNAHLDHQGHVHTTRLDHGWSWRIPLPGKVSVGIVIGSEFLPQFGQTKEERYDNLLLRDSVLKKVTAGAKRLTPVMEYTNYQLVSSRLVGDGWALVGDTAGFIDPVFSSGLFLSMNGARLLSEAVIDGSPEAFKEYERMNTQHITTWHEIVSYFYSGRLFTFFNVGQMMKDTLLVKMMTPHLDKHLSRIFGGGASNARYSVGLLRFAMKHGLKNEDPRELAIR